MSTAKKKSGRLAQHFRNGGMATKKKRVDLGLEDRVKVIESKKCGNSHRVIARKFNCSRSQVQRILEKKEEILQEWTEFSAPADRKRKRTGKFEEVEKTTLRWFHEASAKRIPISGPMIQEKAKKVAAEYAIQEFTASNGWLQRFRERNNIVLKARGEGRDPDENDWKSRLPYLLEGYKEEDIFNMNETGLFFRALPSISLIQKGKDAKGGKMSKERITIAFCCSATGEKVKPLVIGKAEKPLCFKGINIGSLGVHWCSNRKAWMTSEIFITWLQKFNLTMKHQNRNVLLLLENAPCHPRQTQFSNVKTLFFPPNLTSKLQPLDQGIIRAFKLQYRKLMMRTLMMSMDTGNSALELSKSLTVLDAIRWTRAAWDDVSTSTISKCFAMCGIVNAPDEDVDEPDLTNLANLIGICEPWYEEDLEVFKFTYPQGAATEEAEEEESGSEEETFIEENKVTSSEACEMLKRLRSLVTTYSTLGDEHPSVAILDRLEHDIQEQFLQNINNVTQQTLFDFLK